MGGGPETQQLRWSGVLVWWEWQSMSTQDMNIVIYISTNSHKLPPRCEMCKIASTGI